MSDLHLSLIDTGGLGEAAEAIAGLVRPYVEAHAEAWSVRLRAKAQRDAGKIQLEGEVEIAERAARAAMRIARVEARRQRNLEEIVQKALSLSAGRSAGGLVDDGWAAQFFDRCQDVSDDEMQTVWAKILAGEVERPGTFSLRTIRLVQVLARSDAELFIRAVGRSWLTSEARFVFYSDATHSDFEYEELLHLQTIGLVASHSELRTSGGVEIAYGDARYRIWANDFEGRHPCRIFPFTDIGKQLAPLATGGADTAFRDSVLEALKRNGVSIRPESRTHSESSRAAGDQFTG